MKKYLVIPVIKTNCQKVESVISEREGGVMSETESILLGGGCFWCTEAVFKNLRGVIKVTPGYAGGNISSPDYQQVCTGHTGHAEVIRVDYDPAQISLKDLLKIFFTTHDPTQYNRQGHDVGTQYRSIIFGNQTQQETARGVKEELEKEQIWPSPIVTAIEGPVTFWEAESEHHDYFSRHPHAAYCEAVIAPKVIKARKLYRTHFLEQGNESS